MSDQETIPTDHDLPAHLLSGWRFRAVFITIFLSIIGYFLFMIWGGWDHVILAVSQVGVLGISAALTLSLVNYLLRFLRWTLFLKNLGHTLPWWPHLRIYMSGFALTTTPGKTGEAVRGLFLKDYGVPYRKSIGLFFSERLSDLISVLILASAGLWSHSSTRPLLLAVAGFIIALLALIQSDRLLKAIERLAGKWLPPRFVHTVNFFLETVIAFRSCFVWRVQVIALALGVIAWTAEALALYILVHLVGGDLSFATAMFIYGFSLVIGGITLLPGGLGGAEVTMLQLLMINQVSSSVAVAITLVIRLTSLWFAVLLGMIALPKKKFL